MKVPKIEERTFEKLQVVDVLAFGEVKFDPTGASATAG